MILKKITFLILLSFIITNISKSDFKEIKKKAINTKPEIIFPIREKLDKCINNMYVNQITNPVLPVIKVEAPSGYGLDNRFMYCLLYTSPSPRDRH